VNRSCLGFGTSRMEEDREGVKEGEYGGNITYSYMKMEK
jgi:hypothetical protein